MAGLRFPVLALALAVLITGRCDAFAGQTATLSKIRESATLVIGFQPSAIPFSYTDNASKPQGFSIDLCEIIAGEIKAQLEIDGLALEYKPIPADVIAPALESGSIDINCGAAAGTTARRSAMGLSTPIFVPEYRWLVRSKTKIKNAADLTGKTVAVTAGSATNPFIISLSNERSAGLSILPATNHAEAFQLLENNEAAAFLEDDIVLAAFKASAKKPNAFTLLEDAYESVPYCLAMRKGDSAFASAVNAALETTMASDTFERLYVKWFQSFLPGSRINLAFPMPEALQAVVRNHGIAARGCFTGQ